MSPEPASQPIREESDHLSSLGDRLKALRLQRGMSLNQVSATTGVSKSFLSLVENGRSDISIGRLLRIGEVYGVSLVDLLPTAGRQQPNVVRADERTVVGSTAERVSTYMLATDPDGTIVTMDAMFESKAATKEFRQHQGQEFVYILEGQLSLEFADGAVAVLDALDSACFDAERLHNYRNSGRGRLRFISISVASEGSPRA